MKVLIVDDDKLVAISLKTILEADGAITVSGIGYNGADAICLYRETKPDVLLMDIRMEGIGGLEAAEKILKEKRRQKSCFSRPSPMMNIL